MSEQRDAESKWLARTCVGAFLVWLPLELLRGVVPAASIYDFIKDPGFGNLATAFGALGTVLAIVGTAAVARHQIAAAISMEERKTNDARRVFAMHVVTIWGIGADIKSNLKTEDLQREFIRQGARRTDLWRALQKLEGLMAVMPTDLLISSTGEFFLGFWGPVIHQLDAAMAGGPLSAVVPARCADLAFTLDQLHQQERTLRPVIDDLLRKH